MRAAVFVVLLATLVFPAPAGSQDCWVWEAGLIGDLVVPQTFSPGRANISASFQSCDPCVSGLSDSLEVRISIIDDLEGDPVSAEFRRGAAGANGPAFIILPLEDASFPLTRTVVIPSAHCPFLTDTLTYVVITTLDFPDGEVRGQLIPRPPVPVREVTWGQIRSLYR